MSYPPFEQQLHDELLPGVRLFAWVLIIGFASCVPVDYVLYAEKIWDLLRVRLVVIAAACLVLGLSYSRWTKNHAVLRSLSQLNVMSGGLGLACLTYAAGGSTCPYWTMMLVLFFAGVVLQRFSMLEALVVYSSIIVFYAALLFWSGEPILAESFVVSTVGQFIGMVVAVVAAAYLRTLQRREFAVRSAFAEASTENQKILEELGNSAWVKGHSADMAAALQGIDSIPLMARQLMTRLTPLLGAQVGVFYYFDAQTERFTLMGSHGYKLRKDFNQHFRMGEGIVGQCAVERAPILLTDVPPDYMYVASTLGQTPPRFVLAAPALRPDGSIAGVVEIGLLGQLGQREHSLFDEVRPMIGVAISILENNQRAAHERND